MAILTSNESLIVKNLHTIQNEGGDGNFVIFQADEQANYYIQLAGQKDDPALHAEAASNQVISEGSQLPRQQQIQIEALGWQPPTPGMMNYSREWLANTDEARLAIAKLIMQTFIEGYGIASDSPLEVILNLE